MQQLKLWVQEISFVLRSIANQTRKFGLNKSLRVCLNYIGLKNYMDVEFPLVGIHVSVEARNPDLWTSLESSNYEFNCIRHISQFVKEGHTIFDLGAGIGVYTLLFSKLVNENGQIFVFEPDQRNLKVLRNCVVRNQLLNVDIQDCAITDSCGEATFRAAYDRWGTSMSALVGKGLGVTSIGIGLGVNARETTVRTSTIDRFCEEHDIRPDGIKIDIEGAEALAIEGSRNVIEKYSPWVLLEFHGHFMSEEDRMENWHKIMDSATQIIFIDGDSKYYNYGDKLTSIPDCPYCHVFIEY